MEMRSYVDEEFHKFLEETHHLHDLLFQEKSLEGKPSLRKAIHAGLELCRLCFRETMGSNEASDRISDLDRYWRDFSNAKIREGMKEEEVESVSVWFDDDAESDGGTDAF